MPTPYLDSVILQVRRHPDVEDLFNGASPITSAATDGVWTAAEITEAIVRGSNAFLSAAYEMALAQTGGVQKAALMMATTFPEIEATVDLANPSGSENELFSDLPTDYMGTLSAQVVFANTAPSPSKPVRIVSPQHADLIAYSQTEERGPAGYAMGGKFRVVARGTVLFDANAASTIATIRLRYIRSQKSITQGGSTDLMLGTRYDVKIVEAAAALLKSRS